MRKCVRAAAGAVFCGLCVHAGMRAQEAAETLSAPRPEMTFGTLAKGQVERAKTDVARIALLVDQGTLPRTKLNEAKEHLADAEDQETLAETLYGQPHAQDMTPDQVAAMVAAADRRVAREQVHVDERHKLMDSGILAKSEFEAGEAELASRQQVSDLAHNRALLVDDLRQMAEAEQALERDARANGGSLKNLMTRYDGNGQFSLGDLTTISSQFQKRFHHPLPISALGQTAVHRQMGLDHRNRVDVALNPDQPEGLWLRQLLERLHIPYLAFRSAIAGAATAPHIHIGTGSTRLALALR